MVYGYSFVNIVAEEEILNRCLIEIQNHFQVNHKGRVGPDHGGAKSIIMLNRVVSWKNWALEYDADQRHAETI